MRIRAISFTKCTTMMIAASFRTEITRLRSARTLAFPTEMRSTCEI